MIRLISFNIDIFSERTVELMLYFENLKGIAWCGISGKKLEPLAPKSKKTLEFKAVPLLPGLTNIAGIKLLDTFLKRTYTYDALGQVFVIIDSQKVCKN